MKFFHREGSVLCECVITSVGCRRRHCPRKAPWSLSSCVQGQQLSPGVGRPGSTWSHPTDAVPWDAGTAHTPSTGSGHTVDHWGAGRRAVSRQHLQSRLPCCRGAETPLGREEGGQSQSAASVWGAERAFLRKTDGRAGRGGWPEMGTCPGQSLVLNSEGATEGV